MNSDDSTWTDTHREVRDQMIELARKYFDGYVLIVNVASVDTHEESIGVAYGGGKTLALGLAQRFIHDTLHDTVNED